jgi:Fanconi anemia group M protein
LSKGKRVLIVAPTDPLVNRHLTLANEVLELPEGFAAKVAGPAKARAKMYADASKRVFAGTAEAFISDIEKNRLDLKGVDLVVFDEVHHAVGEGRVPYKHAYAKLGRLTTAAKVRSLGLSAALSTTFGGVERLKKTLGVRANRKIDDLQLPETLKQEYKKELDLDPGLSNASIGLHAAGRDIVRMLFKSEMPGELKDKLRQITGVKRFHLPAAGEMKELTDSLRKLSEENLDAMEKAATAHGGKLPKESKLPVYEVPLSNLAALGDLRHLNHIATTLGRYSFLNHAHRRLRQVEDYNNFDAELKSKGSSAREEGIKRPPNYWFTVYEHPGVRSAFKSLSAGTPYSFAHVNGHDSASGRLAAQDVKYGEAMETLAKDSKFVDHPKEAYLFRRMREASEKGTLGGTMVITDQADHAKFLARRIFHQVSTAEKPVLAVAACGQKSMRRKELNANLGLFASEQAQVMAGTRVLEEGNHFPSAVRAIMYSPAPEAIRVAQRRGRVARRRVAAAGEEEKVNAGLVIHLLAKGTPDIPRYYSGQSKFDRMKKIGQYTAKQQSEPFNHFGAGRPKEIGGPQAGRLF